MADPAVDELSRAYAAFSRGDLDESGALCANVLRRDARDAQALHLAAVIALRRGEPAAALERIGAAIESAPRDARLRQTRGLAYRILRRPEEAEADFREALRLWPDFADAHASLGLSLFQRGEHSDARSHLESALATRPDEPEWRYNLALCESQAGNPGAAREALLQVIRVRPQWPEALNALGGVLAQLGDARGAAGSFEGALRIQPQFPAAWNNLGGVLLSLGRIDDARECFKRCLALAPTDAHAWSNLGNALRMGGDRGAAIDAYRHSLVHGPGLAAAWQNLGNTLREEGRMGEALEALRRAVQVSGAPEHHLSLALALLATGDLTGGWSEYRWRHGTAPREHGRESLLAAIRAGEALEIRGEQGLGDVLFFLRWAPRLRDAGATLRLRADARLQALLGSTGIFTSFVDEANSPESAPAHLVAAGDLPFLLGEERSIPPPLPVQADTRALEAARKALRDVGPPPYVGVAWRSGTPFQGGEERLSKNIPVEALGAALTGIPGTVISLQRRPPPGETSRLEGALGRPVMDACQENEDLGRVTALLAALDHYVGVSSTNVHIAAGLGKKASILVPDPPEWRYGVEGSRTPWFPDFRVYRQDAKRGWDDALAALRANLSERLAR